MNYSRQRELIENAVKAKNEHPTADEIFMALREELPKISLATVYRNLRILTDEGKIRTIGIPNSKDRFDGVLDEHFHVLCEDCGRLFDININIIDELDIKITEQTGVIPKIHQIVISGLCKNCNEKG